MVGTFLISTALYGEPTWLVLVYITSLISFYMCYLYYERKYKHAVGINHIKSQIGQFDKNLKVDHTTIWNKSEWRLTDIS